MQTSWTISQDYTGPTRNPHHETLKRLTAQFANVKGPAQVKKCLKAWGLADEISPRQARFWEQSSDVEKRLFVDMAGVSTTYTRATWAQINERSRAKIWRAIVDATQWGERLRGRF